MEEQRHTEDCRICSLPSSHFLLANGVCVCCVNDKLDMINLYIR